MEQWEKNYYISAIAGSNNGSSLVVMSKGEAKQWIPLAGLLELMQFLTRLLSLEEVSDCLSTRSGFAIQPG